MKCIHVLLIVLICLVTFSCNEKPAEKLETIRIYGTKEVPAKELIDKVDFVKLETTADNIIGSVSKILFTDSLIIIVDKGISKAVFVFDKKGHYLRKIGNLGGGPTEYSSIVDATLSFDKTKIHILSVCKVLTYEFNGKFIEAQKLKNIAHCLECIDKNTFAIFNVFAAFYSNDKNRHMLEVVNNNFDKIIYKGIKPHYNENDVVMAYANPLINVRGKVFALPELSDTIFLVNNQEVTPRYYIESEKPKLSSNELVSSAKKGSMKLNPGFNGGFYHIDDYIIIAKIFSSTPLIFYNTKTKNTYSYDAYKLKDTHALLAFTNTLKTQYKSSLVTVAPTSDLISMKDGFYKCYDKKMIDRLFENMTEDDNPVLLFYNVNKNGPK